MKPRSLRHRLEKASKLLVIIQKHIPEVSTRFADSSGIAGQVVVSGNHSNAGREAIRKLGKELESKGYSFKRTKNRWLGITTIHGKKEERPDIVIELETPMDRLNHAEESKSEAYSFSD